MRSTDCRRKVLHACLLTFGIVVNSIAMATDAIIVGGGYTLQASQGQIELNVKWVQSILNNRDHEVRVFYTDGDSPELDVHAIMPAESQEGNAASLKDQALNRVFGNEWGYETSYYNHTVPDVSGSTKADQLVPSLRSIFSDVSNDVLFVYNGHGAQSPSNKSDVSLMLWDNSRLSASSLHEIIADIDQQSTFRYVFTQCYSGGFNRLIYDNPASGLKLHEQTRCGFTAESAYRLAEGCSASVNTDDYRDYTTFFFAALDGVDRNGRELPTDPDRNADGTTTMREAHLYTLETAISTDLPRASSEDYLIEWRPWHIRWSPAPAKLLSNEYTDLYRSLLVRNNIEDNDNAVSSVRSRLNTLEQEFKTLVDEQYQLFDKVDQLRERFARPLTQKHPELLSPYSSQYTKFIENDFDSVATWISEQPEFQSLIELQQQVNGSSLKLLDKEREITQMQKILRARKLSTLKSQLYKHGSEQHQADYQRLVECEESPLDLTGG